MIQNLSTGVAHKIPKDLKDHLSSSEHLIDSWNNLTPLARNEWICWTISVKKIETRKQHIERLCADITKGKKRPCCWPGCPHR